MEMLNLQIQIFLLLAIGWILGRLKLVDKQARFSLSSLVMDLVLPAAIIRDRKSTRLNSSHMA